MGGRVRALFLIHFIFLIRPDCFHYLGNPTASLFLLNRPFFREKRTRGPRQYLERSGIGDFSRRFPTSKVTRLLQAHPE